MRFGFSRLLRKGGASNKRQMDLVPRRENDSHNRNLHLLKREKMILEEVTKFPILFKGGKISSGQTSNIRPRSLAGSSQERILRE